ncbi:acyl-CoA dehydrogenase [Allokutzneria sp. NRRL B-24872]|uniref:acyl-CoA dehydrogenase family protein n=1 Tax=Allokutzneria sp. NRRL B-24872 TaxID=1137961 RepID=UPI000A37EAD1|nr:acyl-CoA dehydrogenase [Allokutzneria sp. NRRL B-24872]
MNDSPLDPTASALAEALFGPDRDTVHLPWRRIITTEVFRRAEGLDPDQRVARSYERLRALQESVGHGAELAADPRQLASMHEWTAVVDPATSTIAGIHYNLFLGSLLDHDTNPKRELADFTSLRRTGTFLCTEVAHGNDVIALETTAEYDRTTAEFVLHTPSPGARKFMPNTSLIGGPKSAVVAARLIIDDQDHGVFLFLVPLSDERGFLPGVHVQPLPERVGSPIDHCLTSFGHVRLPREALLESEHGRIDDDGSFDSDHGSLRKRVLRSISRVTVGKLCLTASALGGTRAGLVIAVRYATLRTIAGSKTGSRVPLADIRSHHAPLLKGVATAYAMTFLHRWVETRWAERDPASVAEAERLAAISKGWITWQSRAILDQCRERCGAQGLFLANRLGELANDLEGAITAEGDNLVIWVKASAEMMFEFDRTTVAAQHERSGAGEWTDPEFLRDLVAAVSRIWHARAHTALRRERRGDSLRRWNGAVGPATEATEAYARLLATDAFLAAADEVGDPTARTLLRLLCTLFALDYLGAHTGALLVEGHITAELVGSLHETVNSLLEDLAPRMTTLIEGFDVPAQVLEDIPITSSAPLELVAG